jgi:hypothetical protein
VRPPDVARNEPPAGCAELITTAAAGRIAILYWPKTHSCCIRRTYAEAVAYACPFSQGHPAPFHSRSKNFNC